MLEADNQKKEASSAEPSQSADTIVGSVQGPLLFMFETEVDRIFTTPIGI